MRQVPAGHGGLPRLPADRRRCQRGTQHRNQGRAGLWSSLRGLRSCRLKPAEQSRTYRERFSVHVLAHVHAARALAPRIAARRRGHLLLTASAAGLLANMNSAPYSVTKHGTVALAEWLAIRWGDAAVGVSCLSPQGCARP